MATNYDELRRSFDNILKELDDICKSIDDLTDFEQNYYMKNGSTSTKPPPPPPRRSPVCPASIRGPVVKALFVASAGRDWSLSRFGELITFLFKLISLFVNYL